MFLNGGTKKITAQIDDADINVGLRSSSIGSLKLLCNVT